MPKCVNVCGLPNHTPTKEASQIVIHDKLFCLGFESNKNEN